MKPAGTGPPPLKNRPREQSKTDTKGRETSLGTIGQPATLGEQQANCKADYSETDRHCTLGRDGVREEAHRGERWYPGRVR